MVNALLKLRPHGQFPCWIAAGLFVSCVAHAAPTGDLAISNVPGGAVELSASRIDFAPPSNPPGGAAGAGDFANGAATVIAYSGGVLTALTNPYGRIQDIEVASGAIANFIQFYTSASLPSPPGDGTVQAFPAFDLMALLPGGSFQGALNDCAGVTAVGVSCSPLIAVGGGTPFVSPLVLTNRGAYTDISVGISGLGKDAAGSVARVGGLTMQVVSLTPTAIQTILNDGGTVSSPYSAAFAEPVQAPEVGVSEVPTLGVKALAAITLILAAAAIARLRSRR